MDPRNWWRSSETEKERNAPLDESILEQFANITERKGRKEGETSLLSFDALSPSHSLTVPDFFR